MTPHIAAPLLSFIYLIITPLFLTILSLQLVRSQAPRIIIPIMQWVQMVIVAWVTWPVLSGAKELLWFSSDFCLDRLGAMFMLLTTGVVASSMTHAISFFGAEKEVDAFHERVFYAATNAFLLAMTLVFTCNNLGFLWVCIEATTLTSIFLVYFERTNHAIEATWKYLIICSVGIAFALLGTIMIFSSSQTTGAQHSVMELSFGSTSSLLQSGTLNITILKQCAPHLDGTLLLLGFLFCFLGYGTKAGIFPLHNWLPDAHSEAPAPASAMLSGALLNCALFGIWRISGIVVASAKEPHAMLMLVIMGAITAVAGSLFLIRQHSFKRIWAYSSIENVGLMLTSIGIGSGSLFFLQAVNHSIAKVALFLLSGSIIQASGTKRLSGLSGVMASEPVWGVLLLLAALAATGTPPFGMFFSELRIMLAAANATYWPVALALLVAITISFIAICVHVGRIVCGGARPDFSAHKPMQAAFIPALLVICSLALGVAIPQAVWNLIK